MKASDETELTLTDLARSMAKGLRAIRAELKASRESADRLAAAIVEQSRYRDERDRLHSTLLDDHAHELRELRRSLGQ